jgi:hypothetical protein
MGAVMPMSLRPATKVVVFQWPCGIAGTQPLAFLCPAAQAGHIGRRAGLVDEDEFARLIRHEAEILL